MKRQRKVYRISFNLEKDADVIEIVEKIPKTMRGLFFAELIRNYYKGILNLPEPDRCPDRENVDFSRSFDF